MYYNLIKNYVDKLDINHIFNFAYKENFSISLKDANTILVYIKNYWEIIYNGDPNSLFDKLKQEVDPNTFNKVIELYNKYKNKII